MKSPKHFAWMVSLLGILAVFFPAPPALGALSREEVLQLAAQAPGHADYPDADAVILYRKTEVSILSETHRRTTREIVLTVLSEKGKHAWGDVSVRYEKAFETVDVPRAETITPDGRVLEVMEGADNTIIPPGMMNAAVYDAVMERVVSLSGVEPGATLHWIVRRETRYPSGERWIWDDVPFRGRIPILKDEYILRVSNRVPFRYECMNGLDAPEISTGDGVAEYRWNRADIPMIHDEWGMVTPENFIPRLLFTTAASWRQVATWLAGKFDSAPYESDPVIREYLGKIMGDASALPQRIDAVYRWVLNNVRRIDLPLGWRGYAPTPANEILERQYGDSMDMAFLLVTLLRAADVRAAPVLYQSGDYTVPESLPSLADFDSVGVAVLSGDGVGLWLDVTGKNLKTGFFFKGQGANAFIVLKDGYRIIPIPEWRPESSRSLQTLDISLTPDGSARAEYTWTGSGYFEFSARSAMREKTPREQSIYFSRAMNSDTFPAKVASIDLPDWQDFSDTPAIQARLDVPGVAITEGDIMILELPDFPFSFAKIHLPTGKSRRTYPTRISMTGEMITRITIHPPPGFEVVYAPKSSQGESPGVIMNRDVSVDSDGIHISLRETWRRRTLSPEAFSKTKTLYDAFHRLEHHIILLEKKR